MNIAILSPNKNTYSETFIKAQKENLKGNISFYYDGLVPGKLEGFGSIIIKNSGIKKRLGLLESNVRISSLKKSFKTNNIDVVLAQYGTTGNAVCEICENLKIPLVVHFHGFDASIASVIKRNNNYKKLFRIASKVIVVSQVMRQDLLDLGCASAKLVYNPCSPNADFFKINRPKITSKNFVAIGRFTDKKAPYYTILAFSKVLKKHPDARLIFGGDGELLNTCINLSKYLKIESSIDFKGVISKKEVLHLMKSSLAFVQHSITTNNGDKEGTPVAISEASASGLPIVSTLHAGIPDIIKNHETGFLTKEHDVDAMANSMILLIENPELAYKMGKEGKENMHLNFSFAKYIKTLDDTLSSVFVK